MADDSPEVVAELQGALRRVLPGAVILPPAQDGCETVRRVRDYQPELLFLDLEMPRMDGLTTLRALAGHLPARTVVLAPDTLEGGHAAWAALGLGAVDLLPKREGRPRRTHNETFEDLVARLESLLATLIPVGHARRTALRGRPTRHEEIADLYCLLFLIETRHLLRFGRFLAGGGGDLPMPVILEVPHPPRFSRAFCEGLNRMTALPVRIAVGGERAVARQVLLVPGGNRVDRLAEGQRAILRLRPIPEPWRARASCEVPAGLPPDLSAARIGVVLGGPRPADELDGIRPLVARRRLFFLSSRRRVHEEVPSLRTVVGLRAGDLAVAA